MRRYRKTWIFLLIIVFVIQFIQPKKNTSKGIGENDISKVYAIPSGVHQTFTQKCYDCHSNNTRYPWYYNVQPIGWWLAAHVYDGKENLNFSEFRTYREDKAKDKLEEIVEMVEKRSMPLKTFVMMHPETEITPEDEKIIHSWISTLLKTED